jgi:hypothetical protein
MTFDRVGARCVIKKRRIFRHKAHLSGSLSERGTYEGLTLSTQLGGRSSDVQPQDFGEEVSWDRDLGHLEGDIVAVAGDLRWASPAFAQEIAEIIDEGMKLKADGVGGE